MSRDGFSRFDNCMSFMTIWSFTCKTTYFASAEKKCLVMYLKLKCLKVYLEVKSLEGYLELKSLKVYLELKSLKVNCVQVKKSIHPMSHCFYTFTSP